MSELNIPDHWASIELGVLGKFINGYAFKSSDFIEKPDVQLVRMGNITPNGLNLSKSPVYLKRTIFENYPDYALQKNDILLTLTGTIDKEDFGNAVILNDEKELLLNQRVLAIRSDFCKYLYWFLGTSTFRHDFFAFGKGQRQANVSSNDVRKIVTPLPPKGEQERIVKKIESCFQKIDETEKSLNEVELLLSRYRESLLAKAFKGELIPQDPIDEPASRLLEKIRAERAKNSNGKKVQEFAPISDVEKPFDLPEGWEWVRLGEIIIIESGGTPKELPVESDGTHIDFIKVGDMNETTDGKVIDKVQISLSANTVKNLRIKSLPAGTIIFPKRGGAILTNKKRMLVREAACDTNIMGIICPSEMKEYFWWWFQSIHLATLHTGSTIPQINNGDINPLMFPLPPLSHQGKIITCLENKIKKCDEIKAIVDHKIALIHKIKSSILENAFQGLLVPRILSEGTGLQLLNKIIQSKVDSSVEIEKKSPMSKIKKSAKEKAKK